MEKKEKQLPESGVCLVVNTQEIEAEIRRLMQLKKKNEENLSEELLQSRYKKAYERLCDELKERQTELRIKYLEILRSLSEILADSVYLEPETKAAELDEALNREAERFGHDPLADALYIAFYHAHSIKQGREEKSGE